MTSEKLPAWESPTNHRRLEAASRLVPPSLREPVVFEANDGTEIQLRFTAIACMSLGKGKWEKASSFEQPDRYVLTSVFGYRAKGAPKWSEVHVEYGRYAYQKGMKHFKEAVAAYNQGNMTLTYKYGK